MNPNDLYVRMLKDHPIQKEWIKKEHDMIMIVDIPKKHPDSLYGRHNKLETLVIHGFDRVAIWLLSQEDWQEKYLSCRNQDVKQLDRKFKCLLEDFIVAVYNQKYEELQDIAIQCGDMTILWCLFVSKEVYGLEWDWKDNHWCQDRETELLEIVSGRKK